MEINKEQIALKYGLCNCDEAYTKRGLTAPDCPWHAWAVDEAMEDYAAPWKVKYDELNERREKMEAALIIARREIVALYKEKGYSDSFVTWTIDEVLDGKEEKEVGNDA